MSAGPIRPQVVIIDDDPTFLTLMDEILVAEGYLAAGWRGSRGAFEQLRQQPPAALILDLWIEDTESGWRLLDALGSDPSLRDLPVIICSADTRTLHERNDRLRRGNWRSVPKPFDLDDLLGVLAALLAPEVSEYPGTTIHAA